MPTVTEQINCNEPLTHKKLVRNVIVYLLCTVLLLYTVVGRKEVNNNTILYINCSGT